MAFEITVGPPLLTLNRGHLVLASEPDGQIHDGTDKGLYFHDTRLISLYRLLINGAALDLLNGASVFYYASRTYLTNADVETEDGTIPARTLGFVLGRSVGDGLHEDIDITNHGTRPARFNLELVIRSDFADLFDVKSKRLVRRGRIVTAWDERHATLTTSYSNGPFRRALEIQSLRGDSPCRYANGRLTFDVAIAPGQSWHTCLCHALIDGDRRYEAPEACLSHGDATEIGAGLKQWRDAVLKVSTSNEEFYRLYQQSIEDMASLRLPVEGTDHLRFVPAAGVPWFVALFGRDCLIVAMQTVLVYPDFARGALEVLGELQATAVDDYRDAEPGKILHELRFGELARLRKVPHTPYYGTADATPLYLVALHMAWRCSGDRDLLVSLLPVAERCLAWIDDFGDRDGDGFQEYQTRSPAGYENQGWKDAGDAVMHPDGSPVAGPKALCELQGYVYDAWCRMAEIYDHLERPEDARRLREKAVDLYRRFDAAFWDEGTGFYAYCLDGAKNKVMSVASNPGHLLWSGIVPPEKAGRVVERLMRADMWSGWGIRTLSAEHEAFNPYSYQNGSVWPHDNGLIAVGFKRYGLHAEAARIARDISEAASYFALHRMPELYAGIQRDGTNFPVQYLGANVPQAWAAGTSFALLQAILGFVPDAVASRLYLDPWLPDWLPDITLRDLRIGDQVFDIHFEGLREDTRFQVRRGDPSRVERRSIVDGFDRLRVRPELAPTAPGGATARARG